MSLDNIKVFMFDIDGTIINRKAEMTENTKKALTYLKDKGYTLIINSGRPTFSSMKVLEKNGVADLFEYYYGCNGIELVNRKTGEKEFVTSLSPETIRDFDKIFHEDYLSLCFYRNGDTLMMNHFIPNKEQIDEWTKLRFVKPQELDFQTVTEPEPKMILLFEKDKKEEVTKKFRAIEDERVDMFFSGVDVIEVMPKGANKGLAVDAFAKKMGIDPKDIMCFGDAENDTPALAKGTGVYLGSREDADKFNVAYNTVSVDEDGVYKFLNENGLLK
ncbi:MAG: HAD-IIB family hydrolase [Erysipelotrichaceae bacterium]|nr:HAD-IIB family hydrolase [Erysipelotrichaceae bacterium]